MAFNSKLRIAVFNTALVICCLCIVEVSCEDEDTLPGPGVNVCIKKRSVVRYFTATKPYAKPVYRPYLLPCNKWSGTMCSSYRTFYKKSFRQVKVSKLEVETYYTCCPGWRKDAKTNQCNIAICTSPCRNAGICTKPDSCTCKLGWTGADCGEDVNECTKENGGCSQICINTYGSYTCSCKDGYIAKGKSCEVCLKCSKQWKIMEEKLHGLEKEMTTLRKRMVSLEGIQMLSHGLQDKQMSRGAPGPKGEKGDTGPQGPPGPPAEVLGSVIGRLAHFEEYIEQCQCVEKRKENEKEKTDTEHAAVPTKSG